MVRKKIVIDNPTGLHLRPAGTFCKAAIQFESKITVQKITKNENCLLYTSDAADEL